VLWWKRGKFRWQDAGLLSPFFILGAAMGQITASLEKYQVGAIGVAWDHTLAERCVIAGRAIAFYAGKLFWPVDLMFIYPRWSVDAGTWQAWSAPLLCLAVLAILVALSRWIGRGPAAAVMLFYGTLFPALGFVNIYPMQFSFVADHFAYLATLGPIALTAAALAMPAQRGRAQAVGVALAAALLIALGWRTASQARWYHDATTLWTRTLEQNPDASVAYYNLAVLAMARGDADEAVRLMQVCVERCPDVPLAHFNQAIVLKQAKRPEQAMAALQRTIAMYPLPEPSLGMAQSELAAMLTEGGRWSEAAPLLRQALVSRPWHVATRRLLVQALVETNQFKDALEESRGLLDQVGDGAESTDFYNLGLALQRLGSLDEAANAYRTALKLDPDHVATHVNLGALLARQGHRDEALPLLERAVELAPQNAAAQQNLGLVLESKGRRPDAVVAFRQAVALDGNSLIARRRLAWLLAIDPKASPEQAKEALELAQKLSRDDATNLDTLAVAYAAAGQFEQALATVDQALAAANPRDKRLIEQLQQRRALYAEGEAFKQPRPRKRAEPAK
jgi:tetratricopeptide (TPR) repeat protein